MRANNPTAQYNCTNMEVLKPEAEEEGQKGCISWK